MPVLTTAEASERLAKVVEKSKPTALAEIHDELFPDQQTTPAPTAVELARHIRDGLAAEEIVDLWNVVFPADRNVWYDEEADRIYFNEEAVGYAVAD